MEIVASEPAIAAALWENELAGQELIRVQEQAARGDYGGVPVRFLAGVELEAQLAKIPEAGLDADILSQLSQARDSIIADITALEPRSEEEHVTRQSWLEQIPDFSALDICNYIITDHFSRATLSPGNCPEGATYDEALAHTAASGILAFRFGQRPYPWSYYDHPAVSEWPLNATLPTNVSMGAGRVLEYALDEAEYHGLAVEGEISIQTSLSAYRQTADGMWRPILGTTPDRQAATLDAFAGLSAGIEDGSWFSSALAVPRFRVMFHPHSGHEDLGFAFGTSRRHSIRVAGDRGETRNEVLLPSINRALLWGMCSITYGLEKGAAEIAAQLDSPAPKLTPTAIVTPTEHYDWSRHHLLKRMIQQSLWSGKLFFADPNLTKPYGEQFAEQLLGTKKFKGEAAQAFCEAFVFCVNFDETGRVSSNNVLAVLDMLIKVDPSRVRLLRDAAGGAEEIIGLLKKSTAFLKEDAVRVHLEDHPSAVPNFPVRSVAEWATQLPKSEIFSRMYGEYAPDYAKLLGLLLAHHDEKP